MKHQVIELLSPEINKIEKLLIEDFKLRTGSLIDYVSIPIPNRFEYYLPSILVLLFGNSLENNRKSLHQLACVTQFIYLGTLIHWNVNNQDEESCQFPILIGDYLYGKFFVTLCEADSLSLLPSLSKVIESIHEAGVEEIQLNAEVNEIEMLKLFEKRWGEFFGLCCKIGANMANLPNYKIEIAYSVGVAIGQYFGVIKSEFANNVLLEKVKDNVLILAESLGNNFLTKSIFNLVDELDNFAGAKPGTKSILVG